MPPIYQQVYGTISVQTSAYTLLPSDKSKLISCSGTWTLTIASGTLSDPTFYCFISNSGSGTITVAPQSGTIDGAASVSLGPNQGMAVFCDGTNAKTERGGGGGIFSVGGVNAQTGTAYTVQASDNTKLLTLSNLAAVTVTLPANSSLSSQFYICIENLNTGAVTLTPTGLATIDGAATLVLNQNQGVVLFNNGTNWFTERGLGASGGGGIGGVNAQTGVTYTVASSDNGKLVTLNNASPVAVTLPANSGLSSTFVAFFENLGAGVVTFTPTGLAKIDGASSLSLFQNQGTPLFSDGTNWFTMRGVGSAGVNIQTGATYTVQLSDNGKIIVLNRAAGIAVTLPTPASAWTNFACSIFDANVGASVLTPQSGTIVGAANLTLGYGEGVELFVDVGGGLWWPNGGIFPSGVNTQTGTSYTIGEIDLGKLVTFNNASPVAVSLPVANTLGNKFHCSLGNLGAGLVTITPAAGTIDGGSSVQMSKNQGLELYYDGTNYFTMRGLGVGGAISATFSQIFPDYPPASPSAYDDEFNGAAWDAKWGAPSDTFATRSFNGIWPSCIRFVENTGVNHAVSATQTIGGGIAGDFSIAAKFLFNMQNQYEGVNLRVLDSLGNNEIDYKVEAANAGGSTIIYVANNILTAGVWAYSGDSNQFLASLRGPWLTHLYLLIQRVSNNWWLSYSLDGYSWVSTSRKFGHANLNGTATTTIGFNIYCGGTAAVASVPYIVGIDWFRYNWLQLEVS